MRARKPNPVEYEAPSMCFVLEFHRCISFRPRCISRRIKLNRHRPFLFILRETGKKISRPPSPPPTDYFSWKLRG